MKSYLFLNRENIHYEKIIAVIGVLFREFQKEKRRRGNDERE